MLRENYRIRENVCTFINMHIHVSLSYTVELFKFVGANFRGLSIFLQVRWDVVSCIGWWGRGELKGKITLGKLIFYFKQVIFLYNGYCKVIATQCLL